MFIGLVNQTHEVSGRHIAELKRQASRVANQTDNLTDIMVVWETPPETLLRNGRRVFFQRVNQRCPDGSLQRGAWG